MGPGPIFLKKDMTIEELEAKIKELTDKLRERNLYNQYNRGLIKSESKQAASLAKAIHEFGLENSIVAYNSKRHSEFKKAWDNYFQALHSDKEEQTHRNAELAGIRIRALTTEERTIFQYINLTTEALDTLFESRTWETIGKKLASWWEETPGHYMPAEISVEIFKFLFSPIGGAYKVTSDIVLKGTEETQRMYGTPSPENILNAIKTFQYNFLESTVFLLAAAKVAKLAPKAASAVSSSVGSVEKRAMKLEEAVANAQEQMKKEALKITDAAARKQAIDAIDAAAQKIIESAENLAKISFGSRVKIALLLKSPEKAAEGFQRLFAYLQKIEKTNPGKLADIIEAYERFITTKHAAAVAKGAAGVEPVARTEPGNIEKLREGAKKLEKELEETSALKTNRKETKLAAEFDRLAAREDELQKLIKKEYEKIVLELERKHATEINDILNKLDEPSLLEKNTAAKIEAVKKSAKKLQDEIKNLETRITEIDATMKRTTESGKLASMRRQMENLTKELNKLVNSEIKIEKRAEILRKMLDRLEKYETPKSVKDAIRAVYGRSAEGMIDKWKKLREIRIKLRSLEEEIVELGEKQSTLRQQISTLTSGTKQYVERLEELATANTALVKKTSEHMSLALKDMEVSRVFEAVKDTMEITLTWPVRLPFHAFEELANKFPTLFGSFSRPFWLYYSLRVADYSIEELDKILTGEKIANAMNELVPMKMTTTPSAAKSKADGIGADRPVSAVSAATTTATTTPSLIEPTTRKKPRKLKRATPRRTDRTIEAD